MKIFLTGGSSPLGELLVPKLTAHHHLEALVRSEMSQAIVRRSGAHGVLGDLTTPAAWWHQARSADCIIHMAGMQHVGSIMSLIQPHQFLTVISSASVRNTAHPRSSELAALETKLALAKPDRLVLLRPTMIYGSTRDRNVRVVARLVAKLPIIPRFVGGQHIQPVFVDDVADAIVRTLFTSTRLEADLGGPNALTLGDLVAIIARHLDRKLSPIPVPVSPLAAMAGWTSGLRPNRVIHALAMLAHERTTTSVESRLLGREATPFEQGIELALTRYGLRDNQPPDI